MKLYLVLQLTETGSVTGKIRIFKNHKEAVKEKDFLHAIFPKDTYIIENNEAI